MARICRFLGREGTCFRKNRESIMQSVGLAKKRVSACFFVFQKIGVFLLRRLSLSNGGAVRRNGIMYF